MSGLLIAIIAGIFLLFLGILLSEDIRNKIRTRARILLLNILRYQAKLNQARSVFKTKTDSEKLLSCIKKLYPNETILSKGDCRYPVAIYPTSLNESLLLKDCITWTKESIQDPKSYKSNQYYRILANKLKLLLREGYDNKLYAMRSIITHNQNPCIECETGFWNDNWDTSESLEWEIRRAMRKVKDSSNITTTELLQLLPLRKHLHNKVGNPVKDGTHRCAAVGVSTLIAYKKKSENMLILGTRGRQGQPLRYGCRHVIPSFYFRPAGSWIDECFSVENNIYREYLGELYSYEDSKLCIHPEKIMEDSRICYLRHMIENQDAELRFTGIAINLLNLRPEICMLLLIRSEKWWKEQGIDIKLNPEYISGDEHDIPDEDMRYNIQFEDDSKLMDIVHPSKTSPPGAAAFWLGVDMLKQIL